MSWIWRLVGSARTADCSAFWTHNSTSNPHSVFFLVCPKSCPLDQTHSTSVVELKQHEEAKPRVVDGHSVSGTLHHLTLAAPGLIAAIEDVGRRLHRAPSSSEHGGGKDDNEGKVFTPLLLAGPLSGVLPTDWVSGRMRLCECSAGRRPPPPNFPRVIECR